MLIQFDCLCMLIVYYTYKINNNELIHFPGMFINFKLNHPLKLIDKLENCFHYYFSIKPYIVLNHY